MSEDLSAVDAVVYGVIQGFTEFLPVSSSGHLALAHKLGLGNMSHDMLLPFSLLLHLGSLVAICYAFRHELIVALRHINPVSMRNVLLSIAPAIIAGLTCKDYIKEFEQDYYLMMICFMVTSVLLLITHRRMHKQHHAQSQDIEKDITHDESVLEGSVLTRASARQALIVGLLQATALLPGISRSGACICAALLCGMISLEALAYAFIIGIPLIAGAAGYELLKSEDALSMFQSIDLAPLIIGFGTSIATGLIAIWMLRFVMVKNHLHIFSLYTAMLAIFCLTLVLRNS